MSMDTNCMSIKTENVLAQQTLKVIRTYHLVEVVVPGTAATKEECGNTALHVRPFKACCSKQRMLSATNCRIRTDVELHSAYM